MNKFEALAYLTRCADDNGVHWYQGHAWSDVETCPTCHGSNDAGHLGCPGSRYGHSSAHVAEYVWRIARAERDTSESNLDFWMRLAVNDSEVPQRLLEEHAAALANADIDAMTRGYLECQLWAQHDYDREDECLDASYDLDDISSVYVETVRDELAALVTQHPLAVRMYLAKCDARCFGHDFYLTREGHGAGFWDRDLGELGEYLTQISKWAGAATDLWDNGNGELTP